MSYVGSRGVTIEQLARMGRPVRTYGTGRTCAVCGCKLSQYNPDTVCAVCDDGRPVVARKSGPQPADTPLGRQILRHFDSVTAAACALGWPHARLHRYVSGIREMPEANRKRLVKLIGEWERR